MEPKFSGRLAQKLTAMTSHLNSNLIPERIEPVTWSSRTQVCPYRLPTGGWCSNSSRTQNLRREDKVLKILELKNVTTLEPQILFIAYCYSQ